MMWSSFQAAKRGKTEFALEEGECSESEEDEQEREDSQVENSDDESVGGRKIFVTHFIFGSFKV